MMFDPDAPDQIVRRARIVLAALLMRAFIVADEHPSTAMADYFREHLREQERYEADMRTRYDSLSGHPGILPVPNVRRVA
jgi:hypothetical protein